MWVLPILHDLSQHPFVILGQGWQLNRSSANVSKCNNLYPIITKLIAIFKSRSGNVSFNLDHKAADYHNKTNCIIECVLL